MKIYLEKNKKQQLDHLRKIKRFIERSEHTNGTELGRNHGEVMVV